MTAAAPTWAPAGAPFSELDARLAGWRDGRALRLTLRPLYFRSRVLGATIAVPGQFYTDFASVPRAPGLWLVAGAKGERPATVHDFPYQFGFWWVVEAEDLWVRFDVGKPLADEVFGEGLRADPWSGCSRADAWLMERSVRWFGRGNWEARERRAARGRALNPVWASGAWADDVPQAA